MAGTTIANTARRRRLQSLSPFIVPLVLLLSPALAANDESCTAQGTCKYTGTDGEDALKALPGADGSSGTEGVTQSLADQIGPMVINEDGTMKRIANWQEMTEAERANTLRVLGKRNQKRIQNLKSIRQEMVTMVSDAAIIPDVIPDVDDTPLLFIKVSYKATDPRQPWIELQSGMELTPALSREEPVVSWPAPAAGSADSGSSFMTLIMVDPDAPSRESPKFRNWLHWMVVDIENSGSDERAVGMEQPRDARNGVQLASYKGPTPPKDTGLHRYVFLLFRHTSKIADAVDKSLDASRNNFNLDAFTAKHGLGAPASVQYFTCKG